MNRQYHVVATQRRGGAVIIVVLSLLTMLVFMGLFFYGWTSQERANAEYFAMRGDDGIEISIETEPIFEHGLRQVIVSTRDEFTNSALFGSRWSLAAHVMGPLTGNGVPFQTHPYSGMGITVRPLNDGAFHIDYDGVYDPSDSNTFRTQSNFVLNFSPLANGGNDLLATNPEFDFNPAAGYTYPDINSLFLAMDYIDPVTNLRVIKPSFALPGYFPERRNAGPGAFSDWYLSGGATAARQVLRPHQSLSSRYVSPANWPDGRPAESGDTSRIIQPFPFVAPNGRMGVWDGSGEVYSMLDTDLSGDGVQDSISIDLDHPLIDLPGGRQVVPIFHFKIIDQDALLNPNVHGHMPEFQVRSNQGEANIFTDVYNRTTWVHSSNLGLSTFEINPAVALYANPHDPGFTDPADLLNSTVAHRGMISPNSPSPPLSRFNVANMELAMMLIGRPDFTEDSPGSGSFQFATLPGRDWLGRYGFDDNLLRTSLMAGAGMFPSPGLANADDDLDSNMNAARRSGGMRRFDQQRLGGTEFPMLIPPFIHPLDFVGLGMTTQETGERHLAQPGIAPMQWPQYSVVDIDGVDLGAWQYQGANALTPTYRNAFGGLLQQGIPTDYLINEANEIFVNPDANDALFGASEIAALHLSNRDWRTARMPSRLRSLAPFNFEFNRQAHRIRSQFTTQSWDRTQFSYAPPPQRPWEINDNFSGDHFRFPPAYGVNPSRHEDELISPQDPFRPEVRRLLTVRYGANALDGRLPQQRLNLNRILSDDRFAVPGGGSEMQNAFVDLAGFSVPRYRDLVPHPTEFYDENGDLMGDPSYLDVPIPHQHMFLPAGAPAITEIVNDRFAQEWWARYDRQRLARDIYVLLYTLAGHDGANVDTTNVTAVPVDPVVAREMAQFAVNYVDALDRDNVITRFEYDPDLRDGWTNPAEVVYGVEAQQLTFSEALFVETVRLAEEEDNQHTLHDESKGPFRFLYLELRNVSPFPVELDNDTWRIVRVREEGEEPLIAVDFRANGPSDNPDRQMNIIGPGQNFLIGCHDGTVENGAGQPIGSEMYVRTMPDQDLECVIPKGSGQTVTSNQVQPPNDQLVLDLDLTPVDDSDFRTFEPIGGGYAGTTLVEPGDDGPTSITLVLQRRRNLDAAGFGEDEWVEVDRLQNILVQTLNVGPDDGPGDPDDEEEPNRIVEALRGIPSQERLHPFIGETQDYLPPPMDSDSFHSMAVDGRKHQANDGWRNMRDNEPYPFWQPHFDRDFSSVMELLSVPIYGLRSSYAEHEFDSTPINGEVVPEGGVVRNLVLNNTLNHRATAQRRILRPDTGLTGNRWYRLLNFVQVDRNPDILTEPTIPDPGTQWWELARNNLHRRHPGRLNPNTLRHEHVLAAWVDDTHHHGFNPNEMSAYDLAPTLDAVDDVDRWWMEQLLIGRDGWNQAADPSNSPPGLGGTRRQPPGTHRAKPFRPLGHLSDDVDESILRRNASGAEELGLFEARSSNDVNVDSIDYHTRHRILAKVANNSTTRSHVFAIWAGFTLHEAHQLPNGNVQIGARAEDLPVFRKFLVVDMSRLEEALDASVNPPRFDFRKFIIHQQRLP